MVRIQIEKDAREEKEKTYADIETQKAGFSLKVTSSVRKTNEGAQTDVELKSWN